MKKVIILFCSILCFACSSENDIFIDDTNSKMSISANIDRSTHQLHQREFKLPSYLNEGIYPIIPLPTEDIAEIDRLILNAEEEQKFVMKEFDYHGVMIDASIYPMIVVVHYVRWNEDIIIPRLRVLPNRKWQHGLDKYGETYEFDKKNTPFVTVSKGNDGKSYINYSVTGEIVVKERERVHEYDRNEQEYVTKDVHSTIGTPFVISNNTPVSCPSVYGGSSIPLRDPTYTKDPVEEVIRLAPKFAVIDMSIREGYSLELPNLKSIDTDQPVPYFFVGMNYGADYVYFSFDVDGWEEAGRPTELSATVGYIDNDSRLVISDVLFLVNW